MPKVVKWRARLDALGFKQVRRVVVFVVGMTVLLFGVALLVLPGPAILVIPAGLAILGLEFRWARRWMRRARELIKSGETRFFKRSSATSQQSSMDHPESRHGGRAGGTGVAAIEPVAK